MDMVRASNGFKIAVIVSGTEEGETDVTL